PVLAAGSEFPGFGPPVWAGVTAAVRSLQSCSVESCTVLYYPPPNAPTKPTCLSQDGGNWYDSLRKRPSDVFDEVAASDRRAGSGNDPVCYRLYIPASFATHGLENGYGIRTLPEGLGHKAVKTTRIYTQVLNRGGRGVRRPADTR